MTRRIAGCEIDSGNATGQLEVDQVLESRQDNQDDTEMLAHSATVTRLEIVSRTERHQMCKQYTVRAHVFLMLILSACLSQLVCRSCSGHSHTATHRLHAHAWPKEHSVCVLPPKQSHLIAQCHTLHLT